MLSHELGRPLRQVRHAVFGALAQRLKERRAEIRSRKDERHLGKVQSVGLGAVAELVIASADR
jgi:hypothetical protein